MRPWMKAVLVIVALIVIGIVFFVACGQGSGGSGTSTVQNGTVTSP